MTNSDAEQDATSGRFSEEEKQKLFSLIKGDPDLLRAFLHQLTKRKWGGKSWMNEIAKRFNALVTHKRKHDAVRHHLKLRKGRNGTGDNDVETLVHLLKHTMSCVRRDTCSKCFQLYRLRVKLGFASCGYEACSYCDTSKPHVLASFDPVEQLATLRAQAQEQAEAQAEAQAQAQAQTFTGLPSQGIAELAATVAPIPAGFTGFDKPSSQLQQEQHALLMRLMQAQQEQREREEQERNSRLRSLLAALGGPKMPLEQPLSPMSLATVVPTPPQTPASGSSSSKEPKAMPKDVPGAAGDPQALSLISLLFQHQKQQPPQPPQPLTTSLFAPNLYPMVSPLESLLKRQREPTDGLSASKKQRFASADGAMQHA